MLKKLLTLVMRSQILEIPAESDSKLRDDTFLQLLSGLNWPDVGFGKDPHSKVDDKHWPTAYALIASAALRNGLPQNGQLKRDVGEKCISWLLDNIGCSTSCLPVWGLPYGRQIWMDEGPCRPGTGFNVPTAHVIQAMCEYADSDSPQAAACARAAHNAATAFVERCSTKIGAERIFWYSTKEAHSYHVMNAIALMAGEIQRVAQLCGDSTLSQAADEAISYVLRNLEQEGETPVWNYFGERIPENKKQKRNDLLHEAFVCQGLMTYKACGGRLGSHISVSDLIQALAKFHRENQMLDFPLSEENKRRRLQPARAIGLAQSLYVLSEIHTQTGNPEAAIEASHCVKELQQDILVDTLIYYRANGEDISSYTRTRSHLVLAFSQEYHRHSVSSSQEIIKGE